MHSERSTIDRENQMIGAVEPGWYPDPEGRGQRWWDGQAWGPRAPQSSASVPSFPPAATFPPQEKSSGVAVLLTVLWPGAGHLYLGLTQKAIPYFVANAIALALGLLLFILLPITILVWVVTLCMTVGGVTQETNQVNDALRRGYRING
jgi:Protein of unknown function (DUF2510)